MRLVTFASIVAPEGISCARREGTQEVRLSERRRHPQESFLMLLIVKAGLGPIWVQSLMRGSAGADRYRVVPFSSPRQRAWID
jgi:hypothetical protein